MPAQVQRTEVALSAGMPVQGRLLIPHCGLRVILPDASSVMADKPHHPLRLHFTLESGLPEPPDRLLPALQDRCPDVIYLAKADLRIGVSCLRCLPEPLYSLAEVLLLPDPVIVHFPKFEEVRGVSSAQVLLSAA